MKSMKLQSRRQLSMSTFRKADLNNRQCHMRVMHLACQSCTTAQVSTPAAVHHAVCIAALAAEGYVHADTFAQQGNAVQQGSLSLPGSCGARLWWRRQGCPAEQPPAASQPTSPRSRSCCRSGRASAGCRRSQACRPDPAPVAEDSPCSNAGGAAAVAGGPGSLPAGDGQLRG